MPTQSANKHERRANKHERRTKETRELLLQAAEEIFARDGYEGAELGEIAARAGRTKGAIYAQFKSKEDIFLALIEDKSLQRRAEAQRLLAGAKTVEENRAALRTFYQNLAKDESWPLLLLEYKLFAIRHAKSKKRLQSFFAEVISSADEARIAAILGPAPKGKNTISRVDAVLSMQPVISALVLESKITSSGLEERAINNLIARIFDTLLDTPQK